jgi:hypothetical protein
MSQFMAVQQAVGVRYLRAFVEEAKGSGLVARGVCVAPPAPAP